MTEAEIVLEQLDKLEQSVIVLAEAFFNAEWEVYVAYDTHDSPGPGWQPFAIDGDGDVFWRRRVRKEAP